MKHRTHTLAAGLGMAAAALLCSCGDDTTKDAQAEPAAEQAEPAAAAPQEPAPRAEPRPAQEPAPQAEPQAAQEPAAQAEQPDPGQPEEAAEEVPAGEATPVPAIPTDLAIPQPAPNAPDAVLELHKAAVDGNMAALNNLGVLYAHGTGVEKDAQKAFSCYYLAAEGGDAEAQFNLARCYVKGEGIAPSVEEFFKWCNKAALNNQVNAQYVLGICYRDGRGVQASAIEAKRWLQRATAQGNEDAARALFAIEHPGETFPADLQKQADPQPAAATAEDAARQDAAATSLADKEPPAKPAAATAPEPAAATAPEPAAATAPEPAAAPAPKPKPAADAPADGYHTLAKGESPATVAKKYGIPLKKLMEINHFTDKDVRRLQIGQKIKVKP